MFSSIILPPQPRQILKYRSPLPTLPVPKLRNYQLWPVSDCRYSSVDDSGLPEDADLLSNPPTVRKSTVRKSMAPPGRHPAGGRRPIAWPGSLAIGLLLVLSHFPCARAQGTQFLPEIDTYLRVNPLVRVSLQFKQTRDGGDPTQAEIGPSMDFYLQPWVKLQNATLFDLDEAKKRALVFSTGYRVLTAPDTPLTERVELIATANYPIKCGVLVSDRNRADLDWTNGKFNWRYRNRLSLEKSLSARSYHPSVYARSEEFYESQYQKWSTTALYAGGILPAGKHLELSPYYCHQNNTGRTPNQELNQIGLIANLYFSIKKK
jgi:Protein of unknown function (DUF2490)